MAEVKISGAGGLPAGVALTGTEAFPADQGSPLSTVHLTAAQIRTYAQANLAAVAASGSASDINSGTLPMGRLALPSGSDLRALSSNGSVVTPDGLMRAVGNISIRPWTSITASAGGSTYGGYFLGATGLNVGTTSTSYAELTAAGPSDFFTFGAGPGVLSTTDWSLPMSLWVRFSHMNNGVNDFADGQRVRVLMGSAVTATTLGTAAPAVRCVGWEFQRNGTAGSLSVFAHNGTTLTSVSALSGLNQFPFGLLRLRTDGLGNAYLDGTISGTPVSASVTGAPNTIVSGHALMLKASYYNTLANGGTMWFSSPWLVA